MRSVKSSFDLVVPAAYSLLRPYSSPILISHIPLLSPAAHSSPLGCRWIDKELGTREYGVRFFCDADQHNDVGAIPASASS